MAEKLLSSETVFPNKIILHKGARKIMVNVDQILYGEAYGDYTRIFTQKEELLSTRGISFLLDNLDKNIFIRLHRSHFANKQYIKEIIKIERYTYAVLAGDVKIKISESFLPDIRKIMF